MVVGVNTSASAVLELIGGLVLTIGCNGGGGQLRSTGG